MNIGKQIFSQVTGHLPLHIFRQCVDRYQGEHYVEFAQNVSIRFS